jgi:hypothetical protein
MEKEITISLPLQISEMKKFLVFASGSILSFFAPFAFGHPQWLVGTIVNACLFLGAVFLPKKYYIPLAVLPSLGVLARGLVFGPFTYFLVYFLPFIWLGNLILIVAFRNVYEFQLKRDPTSFKLKNAFSKLLEVGSLVGLPAFAKFLFLFLIANIYFKFSIVPMLFVTTMGLNQLATALAGGAVSLLIFKLYGGLIKRNKGIN